MVEREHQFASSKAHPWHGVATGLDAPQVVNVYVEIVPADGVKYEVDKASGHLRLDRPQRYSNQCPALYGFIPRTYCGERVAAQCAKAVGRTLIRGDGDPLDICVLSEKQITHGDFLLRAIPIGGLRMIDNGEADDKVIGVLEGDATYGSWSCIADCPAQVLDRLRHYFLTYKSIPGETERRVEIAQVYSRDEAHAVILESIEDYTRLRAGSGPLPLPTA